VIRSILLFVAAGLCEIGGGYLVIVGEEILLPLSFAFLISLLLLPVCNFMENKLRFSRSVASIVAVVLLLIVVCIIFYALGSQIADLGKEWPLLKVQVTQLFNDAQAWLSRTFHVNVEQQTEYLHKSTQTVLNSGGIIIEQTVLLLHKQSSGLPLRSPDKNILQPIFIDISHCKFWSRLRKHTGYQWLSLEVIKFNLLMSKRQDWFHLAEQRRSNCV